MKNGYRIIDADRHLMEPPTLWEEHLETKYRDRAPVQIGAWGSSWVVDGIARGGSDRYKGWSRDELRRVHSGFWTDPHWRTVYRDAMSQGFSPKSYVADMDKSGVDIAICFGTAALHFNWHDKLEPDYVSALCRAYNNWLHDYCGYDPRRLFGIFSLPMQDPKLAAKEAIRAVETLGAVGFFLRPNPLLGRSWHDPAYDYFYDVIEDLGKPLCFHEGHGTDMPQARLPYGKSIYARHAMSHTFENILVCLSMTGMGVFERHPRLKAFFAEATSGWVPFWLDWMDQLYENRALGGDAPIKEKPSYYFKRQGIVSCEAGEETLPTFEAVVGTDNIMWASDYPHGDEVLKFPNTVVPLVKDKRLSRKMIRKILWDNPNTFFGLGLE